MPQEKVVLRRDPYYGIDTGIRIFKTIVKVNKKTYKY